MISRHFNGIRRGQPGTAASAMDAGFKRLYRSLKLAILSEISRRLLMRTWIKHPIAILTEGAGSGVVVDADRIVERVAPGAEPAAGVDRVFDASRHVVVPGLVNTH